MIVSHIPKKYEMEDIVDLPKFAESIKSSDVIYYRFMDFLEFKEKKDGKSLTRMRQDLNTAKLKTGDLIRFSDTFVEWVCLNAMKEKEGYFTHSWFRISESWGEEPSDYSVGDFLIASKSTRLVGVEEDFQQDRESEISPEDYIYLLVLDAKELCSKKTRMKFRDNEEWGLAYGILEKQ